MELLFYGIKVKSTDKYTKMINMKKEKLKL